MTVLAHERVLFLGGNGHCGARLAPARRALASAAGAFELLDVEYPGFEGRPCAPDLEAFLEHVRLQVSAAGPARLAYATGIGGLLALCLRARGLGPELPLLLQAPVLWGLEARLMPRLLRLLPVRRLLPGLVLRPAFQRGFARRQFVTEPEAGVLAGFFQGYAECGALADLFAWLGPGQLRSLEARFAGRPELLAGVTVWWGGRDRVVTPDELRRTEQALGVGWPLRVFPGWGHYPMIDSPGAWVEALATELRGGP